jgi:hypothetical protein
MAISESLRNKLLQQKDTRGFAPNERLIDNKTVDEDGIVVRLLPMNDSDPSLGEDYKSFYCSSLSTGTTSPISFGKECPIMTALDDIWQSDDNELKEHAKNFVNTQNEVWIPVIMRGTDNEELIRILRCKSSIYNQIIDWVMDERFSPMHDPREGCDLLIKKTGKGIKTRWSVDRLGQSVLFEDATLVSEVVAKAHKFDVRNSFYNFNLEKLEQIYEGLTGEDLPGRYHDDLDGFNPRADSDTGEKSEVAPAVTAQKTVEEEVGDLLERPIPEVTTDYTGKKCTFEDDEGETVSGHILGVDDENDNHFLVVEDGGNEEEPWTLPREEVTVAEDATEVKAKRKVRKPSRKASETIRSKASKS